MAPKKQKVEGSSFKDPKFTSKRARDIFEAAIEKDKGFIQERGIDFGDDPLDGVSDIIREFNWHTFVQTPPPGVAPLVMEFYANALDGADGKVKVRGKDVKFDAATINAYYKLPHVGLVEDRYEEYLRDADLNRVIQELTEGRTKWTLVDGLPKKFLGSKLRDIPRVWQYFLNTRLMPTTHNSTVDKSRAILLHAIMTKKTMNVGNIIESQIMYCANNPQNSYSFPQLITALCHQAGVTHTSKEMAVRPGVCLTYKFLQKLIVGRKKKDGKQSGAGTSSSSAPPPAIMGESQVQLRNIQEYQRQQTEWLTSQFQVLFDMQKAHMAQAGVPTSGYQLSDFQFQPVGGSDEEDEDSEDSQDD